MIEAASTLRIAHKTATFQTLFGLLAVTGMRIGEAIALDRSDVDADTGTLTVRNAKFGICRFRHMLNYVAPRTMLPSAGEPLLSGKGALLGST